MKKWLSVFQLLPSIAVVLAAAMGLQLSKPVFQTIVYPEAPVIQSITDNEAENETNQSTDNTLITPQELSAEAIVVTPGVGNFVDGTFTGSGTGYGGTTKVSVTVANKQITSVSIISNNDTPSFFNKALAVVDRIITAQTWEVDSVSGATYSSRGIKDAVKSALTGQTVQTALPAKTTATSKLKNSSFTMGKLSDGTFTGTAKGFGGTIKVSVVIKNGGIASITVLNHSQETSSYYNKAKKIIKNIIKKQTPNVDTISGATYSSSGIREAVKNALKKASGQKVDDTDNDTNSDTKTDDVTVPDGFPADGTFTGTAVCEQTGRFNYNVTAVAVYSGGKLVSLEFTTDDSGKNAKYISSAESVKNAILSDMTGNVDSVSGATFTSAAYKNAYKNAYKQAVEANGGKVDDKQDKQDNTQQKTTDNTQDNASDKTVKTGCADGVYTASAVVDSLNCDDIWNDFLYTLTADLKFENGLLVSISNLKVTEYDGTNEAYSQDAASGMLEKLKYANGSTDNVDVVSGATCSSIAIKEIYKDAYKQAQKAYSENASKSTEPSEEKTDEKIDDTKPSEEKTEEKTDDTKPSEETKEEKTDDSKPSEETKEEKTDDTKPSEATKEEKTDDTKPSEETKEEKTDDSKPSEETKEEKTDDSKPSEETKEEKTDDSKIDDTKIDDAKIEENRGVDE